MKKYIIPALRVADINNETILAGSDPSVNDSQGNGSWHSRERGLFDWTDDEED